jgi:ATP-dependent 26S proteasome regulatory subunit
MAEALSKDELLKKYRTELAELAEEMERIGSAGLDTATVIGHDGKYAVLSSGIYALNKDYKPGDTVLVYPRTGQIVEVIRNNPFIGELFVIDSVKPDWVELRVKGERKLVAKGNIANMKAGDIVLLDKHHTIVRAVVEKVKTAPKITKPVTWDQIGGNEEAKQLLIETVEKPFKYPELYSAYRQAPPAGILLEGDPGCGKTMLGRATATSIGSDGGFISVKGPEILIGVVGETESAIRSLFARARAYKETHGRPAVIFIDEAESLLTHRHNRNNFMGQTVVTSFLTEMDGLDQSGAAIVILSTNRADMLDPAIIRDGRIDYKVKVPRPKFEEAKQIMAIHLKGKPIIRGQDLKALIEATTTELYQHPLPHSGALIAGCVNKAVAHALRRDTKTGRVSGLSADDFLWSVEQIKKQELQHAA